IALSSTINLPFTALRSADLRGKRDGTGDIALELLPDQRVSYLWMWPHVRPWRWTRPQPLLRNLPDAEHAGTLLARAFAAASSRGAVRVETGHAVGHAPGTPIAAGTVGAAP
ncbi:MAG: PH domain-containing protein, partial [Gammaproteobacteria bacterium]